MGRLVSKRREQLTPEQRAQFDEITKIRPARADGQIGGPFDVWVRSPEFAQRMMGFAGFIWERTGIDRGLIELAICVTGRFWESNVEWIAHSRLARENGVDESVLDDIFARQRPRHGSDDQLLVYDISIALHETHELPLAVYTRAVDRFGEAGLVNIISTIGYYTTVSMTLNAFNCDGPEGVTPPFPKPADES